MEILDIEKDIIECYAMIDHFVSLQERRPSPEWAYEISFWRRMLQAAKMQKRNLKKK